MVGILSALLLLCSCTSHPKRDIASGEVVLHQEAQFQMVVPEGWQLHRSREGFSLVRATPYGGGYPNLNVRRVGFDEARDLEFDGESFAGPAGEAKYRYQRWSNSRGRGYRLEVLLWTGKHHFFADASVWDPSLRMDRGFFDTQFWPILHSLEVRGDGGAEPGSLPP